MKAETVPTKEELAIYRSFWARLNSNPVTDEDVAMNCTAELYGVPVSAVKKANIVVGVFKEWAGERLKEAIRAAMRTRCFVEQINYEPTQEAVTIKLRAKAGWSTASTLKTIQRDLMRATGSAFAASREIRRVSVWIVAKMTGGGFDKVAAVEVDRIIYAIFGRKFFEKARADLAIRLDPWYGPALRKLQKGKR